MGSLIDRSPELVSATFDSVSLFSGGLDSFVGAIDPSRGWFEPIACQPLPQREHDEPKDLREQAR